MFKTLTTISTSALLIATSAWSNEPVTPSTPEPVRHSMGYGSLGLGPFPLPLPTFGLGYRHQTGHHGVDLSLQLATIVVVTQLKGSALYHYYFKPNLNSQFYVGGGVGIGTLFTTGSNRHENLISPEFVFGKQYRNETGDLRFFQAQISWPTYQIGHSSHHSLKMPLVIISYGIGF